MDYGYDEMKKDGCNGFRFSNSVGRDVFILLGFEIGAMDMTL